MINSVRLQHFRSYKDRTFELEAGVNIIVGPNASGKTNLLEAIAVLARGGSFRARDGELVSFGQPWSRLDGQFNNHQRTWKLQLKDESLDKQIDIDQKTHRRLGLDKTVPLVYFEPTHLSQLTRGPQERRAYIDELLELTQPEFKRLNNAYKRTLAQRNNLLKRGRIQASQQLFVWDVRLGDLGSQIAQSRQSLVERLNKDLPKTYSKIAGKKSTAQISYQAQFPVASYGSKMVARLQNSLETDLARGFTGAGPHREDIVFILNGHPVGPTASRGEVRSLLLALKTLELKLVEESRDQRPIFLLDDVFSELDGSRRKALVSTLKNYQAIITTTDAEAVLEYFGRQNHNLIALSGRRPTPN